MYHIKSKINNSTAIIICDYALCNVILYVKYLPLLTVSPQMWTIRMLNCEWYNLEYIATSQVKQNYDWISMSEDSMGVGHSLNKNNNLNKNPTFWDICL
jgi:hypothetical protein